MRALFHRIVNTPRLLWLVIVVNWLACSWAYSLVEGKGPIEGPWWGIVTGSTVGYGDQYPESTVGRGIGAWLIVSCLVLVPIAIGHIIAGFVADRDAYTHEEQERARQCDDETNRLAQENNIMLRRLLTLRGQDPDIVIAAGLHDHQRATAGATNGGN